MAVTDFLIQESLEKDERIDKLEQLVNGLSIAKDKPRDTGNPLNDMTGIGGGKPLPKGTPPPKELQLPIPGVDWRKFLTELRINNPELAQNLQIAGDPSFTVGGSKGNKTNQKIIRSGDANAPNATDFMKIRNLGPAMFPIKKAEVNYGKEMPAGYRQWSDRLEQILKKDKPNWLEDMKIHTHNYPKA